MRRYYDTLAAFVRAEDPPAAQSQSTLERVDALQRQMRGQGATITETTAGQIIVSQAAAAI
jgi:hypothetical protein